MSSDTSSPAPANRASCLRVSASAGVAGTLRASSFAIAAICEDPHSALRPMVVSSRSLKVQRKLDRHRGLTRAPRAAGETVFLRGPKLTIGPSPQPTIGEMDNGTSKSDGPDARTCATCRVQMTPIGKLPAISGRSAVKVFRCDGCKSIEVVPPL
jgi:hypothetical protein